MFFNSFFKQVMRFSRSFPPKRTQTLSAYNTVMSISETFKILLIKKRVPRIELCGTPHLIKDVFELIPS